MQSYEAPVEEPIEGVYIPLPIKLADSRAAWDLHHAHFHSNHPLLQGKDMRPVRWSRLQYGPKNLHSRYHYHFESIPLPDTDEARFKTVLLNATNYVPRHAVEVIRKRPTIVPLSDDVRRFMQDEGIMRQQRGRRWAIGWYFARYILENGLNAIAQTKEVAKFVDAQTLKERQILSFGVMRAAAAVVLESIEPTYEQARSQGLIRQPDPTATRFMMRHFDQRQPDYALDIEARLSIA